MQGRDSEGGSSSGSRAPRRGLLARLSSGGQRIAELESIVAHLQELLNTRIGESLSAPDFGIVDFADLVHNFPEATQVPSNDPLSLAFEISGRMASGTHRGPFRVRTELNSSGKMQVSGR